MVPNIVFITVCCQIVISFVYYWRSWCGVAFIAKTTQKLTSSDL